jgi:hypothetical protein
MKQYNNIKDKNKKWIEFKVISKRKEIKAKKKKSQPNIGRLIRMAYKMKWQHAFAWKARPTLRLARPRLRTWPFIFILFFSWLTCKLTFLENKSDNPSFIAINYVLSKRLHFDHQSVHQKLRWVF